METERLLLYDVALVGCAGLGVYLWLRRLRARQQMTESGRLPAKPQKAASEWAGAVFGLLLAVAILAALPYVVGSHFGPLWGTGIAFLVSLVWAMISLARQDDQNRDRDLALAMKHARGGHYDEAIAVLGQAVQMSPTADRASLLGLLLAQRQQWAEALQWFQYAYGLQPRLIHLIYQSIALAKTGHGQEGLALIDQARKAEPQESALACAAALILFELQRMGDAAEQYRQAEELHTVAASEQKTDPVSRYELLQMCRQRLSKEPARGFAVLTKGRP